MGRGQGQYFRSGSGMCQSSGGILKEVSMSWVKKVKGEQNQTKEGLEV